jgi:NADPH:quinone reductase-like Zn-dependent oxidoreductase
MSDSDVTASTPDSDRASSPVGAPLASLWRRGRRPRLLALEDQVVVVTGASSGIGLVTARMAAARGATVVLAARDGAALDEAVAGIVAKGGRATAVVADVGVAADVDRIPATASSSTTASTRGSTTPASRSSAWPTACPSRTCAA